MLNFSISEVVLQRINSMETILVGIKRKSPRILLLVEKVAQLKDSAISEENAICRMIEFLTALDGVKREKGEGKNRESIEQAITIALDIMKRMGGEEIRAEKGDKFEEKKHRIVGRESLNLPENTIVGVLSRGFMFGEVCYPAHVIVAQNRGEIEARKVVKKEKKLPILEYCAYRQYLRKCFARFQNDPLAKEWLLQHYEQMLAVLSLNFDPITNRIKALYSMDNRGCPPYDPIALLRSLTLMISFQFTSIGKWVAEMKTSPFIPVVCGFDPNSIPAVGTYYFLMQRMEDFEYRKTCEHQLRQHEIRHAQPAYRMPKEKPKKDETQEERHPIAKDVLKNLAKSLQEQEAEPIPNDLEKLLNEILLEVAVKISSARNLLGKLEKFVFAADGSTLPSGAFHRGKATCDCRSQGIYSCDCPHKFSDKDAEWGHDTLLGWVFGYRYYQLVCSSGKHDLPLYLTMDSCNCHEGVMFLKSLDRFQKELHSLFPQMKPGYFVGDAIHDSYACYYYLSDHKILYAIPYAHQPSKCLAWPGKPDTSDDSSPWYRKGITVNDKGVPICPAGLPMRHICQHRCGHHVYGCPIKRPTNKGGKRGVRNIYFEECNRGSLCEPNSQWGPYVSIKPDDDPRIHPAIPRDSNLYHELLASRSGCERSNSQKKQHYKLKYRKGRVMVYTFIMTALASLLEHSASWVRDDFKDRKINKENVFDILL